MTIQRSRDLFCRLNRGEFSVDHSTPKLITTLREVFIKMSDSITASQRGQRQPPFFDYLSLTTLINIEEQPVDFDTAAAQYLTMSPTPTEVFRFLPLSWTWDTLLPTLPTEAQCDFSDQRLRRCSASQRAALDLKFPLNAGRPGGKVHAMPSDIVASSTHPWTHDIARLLLAAPDIGWEATTASGVLILPWSGVGIESLLPSLLANFDLWYIPIPQAAKFFKKVHTAVRTTHSTPTRHISTFDADSIYGIDLVTGPSEQLSEDIPAEILMRTVTPSTQMAPALSGISDVERSLVYQNLFDLSTERTLNELIPKEVKWKTFSDWFSYRMGWAASGGAPGARIRWNSDGAAERMNKRGALLAVPFELADEIMRNTLDPLLYSKASTKFEKGKKRAIWNTGLFHYLYQGYVLDCFDAIPQPSAAMTNFVPQPPTTWDAARHTSAERLSSQIYRQHLLAQRRAYRGLMWDFSDFNINHLLVAMARLFAATGSRLAQRLSSIEGSDYVARVRADFDAAIKWIVGARNNTFLDAAATADPLVALVLRSMQSGERATSFQNTMLNRIYMRMLNEWASRYLDGPLLDLISHQGDDVLAIAKTMQAAILSCALLNLFGFAGQTYKITCDFNNHGEFLRLAYDPISGVIRGYPLRSALGLISGEFFMDSTFDPDARAVAYYESYNRANLRGARVPMAFIDRVIQRKCHVTYTDKAGIRHKVVANVDLAMTPAVLGGLGMTGQAPIPSKSAYEHDGMVLAYKSSATRPIFKLPRFNATATIAKVRLADKVTLHNWGLAARMNHLASKEIVESALTGAYDAHDMSHAIAAYASELDKYQKTVQATKVKLPIPLIFSHLKAHFATAWLKVLGLDRSPLPDQHKVLAHKQIAIAIPSGEGKTTLARKYPHLFIDHDDYVNPDFMIRWAEKQAWHAVNSYNASVLIPKDGRILLTWGPETTPPAYQLAQIRLLPDDLATGIRLNADNRAHLLSCDRIPIIFANFDQRDQELIRWARMSKRAFEQIRDASDYHTATQLVFSAPRTPRHSYNCATRYTVPCGFSLFSILSKSVDHIRTTPGVPNNSSGRWVSALDMVPPHKRPSSFEQDRSFLLSSAFSDSKFGHDYFTGGLSFLPPQHSNNSPEIISLSRDLALEYIEKHAKWLFRLDPLDLLVNVSALETQIADVFSNTIATQYLSSTKIVA